METVVNFDTIVYIDFKPVNPLDPDDMDFSRPTRSSTLTSNLKINWNSGTGVMHMVGEGVNIIKEIKYISYFEAGVIRNASS